MKKIYQILAIGFALTALTSCNDYLDKTPDDRAELDTPQKIIQLLVSAYPTCNSVLLNEVMSDNVDDNGRSYSAPIILEDTYKMEDTSEEGNDTPYYIWNGFYRSVATCNEAIRAIMELGNPSSLRGAMAEAKMVRAYSMFQLATTFCMAWNPDKADEYLGLAYPTEPAPDINTKFERGTLRQLYAAINKDIEEALPDITEAEAYYKVPKYHFNVKAAYAFAARFNLYYMNYDKAVEYASVVLGNNPTSVMRNYEPYRELGFQDFATRWIRSEEDANLMIITSHSLAPRYLNSSYRYAHNYDMTAYETFWVDMPWGDGSDANSIIYANKLYGSNQCVRFPTYDEQFEYTDKVAGIGYAHAVDPVFTGDITIVERAEAYALQGKLDLAMADINTWISTHCKDKIEDGKIKCPAPQNMTVADIVSFVTKLDYAKRTPESWRERSMRKHMHPQGFTIGKEGGEQECLLQFILHMKRLETVMHGIRFYDVKRYGIEYSHLVSGEDPVIFVRGDLRGAIQIPQTVVAVGQVANPRMTKEELANIVNSTKSEYESEEEED